MDLNPLACALLLRVKGASTVSEVARASGTAVANAARFFEELARQHVVRWR